jgi:hypothetical protein
MRRTGYGDVGEDFWQEILAIQPKVFFGEPDRQTPGPGEPLLTE